MLGLTAGVRSHLKTIQSELNSIQNILEIIRSDERRAVSLYLHTRHDGKPSQAEGHKEGQRQLC